MSRGEAAIDWGSLYGLLATSCGYTYPQIDAMSLCQVRELLGYWRAHPPVHLLLAAALGAHAKAAPPQDFAALMALAPGGALKAKGRV